ncbi:MAG: hypothetical protein ACRD3C_18730 [Vicinamibacterales bacterium]
MGADRRYIERWQIGLLSSLLELTWWFRRASLNLERRLLRAGVWLMDAQKPRSRQ